MTPPPGFSTPPQIPNITTSERPPATITVFAATTPENTPFAYRASTSTNPNPTISPTFVEANYEILESLLRERQRQTRNEDLWKETGGEGMPNVLGIRRLNQGKVKIGGKSSPTFGSSLRQKQTHLHTPTEFMPIHANPYTQSSAGLVYGQAPNFPFQTQIGNPLAGSTFAYHPQGGYMPHAFTNNSVPSYNGPMHPTITPSSCYPFYTQPMYAPPNIPAYPNLAGPFADSAGFVTPFVRWIEDYPLSDGLKMPSHIGSYDGKRDPDNFLHLFKGAIHMQKYQKTGSILNYEDLKAKFQSHFSQQKKFTKTHLAVHNIKQREGKSTRAFITRYTDDTLQILGLHEEQRISGFVHGLTIRSLVEHLSTDLPSTYKGLIEKTYTWVEARESVKKSEGNSSYGKGCKKLSATSKDVRKHLRTQIQKVVNSGQLSHLVKGIKKERTKLSDTTQGEGKKDKGGTPAEAPILMLGRVYMDSGSSCKIIYEHYFEKLNPAIKAARVDLKTPLVGFSRERSWSVGEIPKNSDAKDGNCSLNDSWSHQVSTAEADEGIKRTRRIPAINEERILSCVNAEEKIIVNDKYPDQTVTIGRQLPNHFKKELQNLLKSNADVFAWTQADMTGIPRTVMVEGKPVNMKHKLNEYSHIKPIKQNKRGLGPNRNMAACKETEELTKVGIL
ncbi:hypothetical protein Tco_0393659 [Tanacetum coccineum]